MSSFSVGDVSRIAGTTFQGHGLRACLRPSVHFPGGTNDNVDLLALLQHHTWVKELDLDPRSLLFRYSAYVREDIDYNVVNGLLAAFARHPREKITLTDLDATRMINGISLLVKSGNVQYIWLTHFAPPGTRASSSSLDLALHTKISGLKVFVSQSEDSSIVGAVVSGLSGNPTLQTASFKCYHFTSNDVALFCRMLQTTPSIQNLLFQVAFNPSTDFIDQVTQTLEAPLSLRHLVVSAPSSLYKWLTLVDFLQKLPQLTILEIVKGCMSLRAFTKLCHYLRRNDVLETIVLEDACLSFNTVLDDDDEDYHRDNLHERFAEVLGDMFRHNRGGINLLKIRRTTLPYTTDMWTAFLGSPKTNFAIEIDCYLGQNALDSLVHALVRDRWMVGINPNCRYRCCHFTRRLSETANTEVLERCVTLCKVEAPVFLTLATVLESHGLLLSLSLDGHDFTAGKFNSHLTNILHSNSTLEKLHLINTPVQVLCTMLPGVKSLQSLTISPQVSTDFLLARMPDPVWVQALKEAFSANQSLTTIKFEGQLSQTFRRHVKPDFYALRNRISQLPLDSPSALINIITSFEESGGWIEEWTREEHAINTAFLGLSRFAGVLF